MVDAAVLTKLRADNELVSILSQYKGNSAIFSETAPEGVQYPYITFRISVSPVDLVIVNMDLYIDIFDRGTSRANARKAARRAEFILDTAQLEDDNYANCRIRYFSGDFVRGDDPLEIHYNQLFVIRATRKKFIKEVTQ